MKDTTTYGADRTTDVCIATVVDLTDNVTTVHTGRCYLKGIWVDADMSAHACPIQDDTTTIFNLPASSGATTYWPFFGARFETLLKVNPS